MAITPGGKDDSLLLAGRVDISICSSVSTFVFAVTATEGVGGGPLDIGLWVIVSMSNSTSPDVDVIPQLTVSVEMNF